MYFDLKAKQVGELVILAITPKSARAHDSTAVHITAGDCTLRMIAHLTTILEEQKVDQEESSKHVCFLARSRLILYIGPDDVVAIRIWSEFCQKKTHTQAGELVNDKNLLTDTLKN